MNLENHPIRFIRDHFGRSGLQFSFAEYRHDARHDGSEGEVFRFSVPGGALTDAFLDDYLTRRLAPDCDLKLFSTVGLDHDHIAMIDFAEGVNGAGLKEAANKLCKYGYPAFYRTGRSFHAYFNKLLDKKQWLQFMGDLLLLNRPDEPPIVDWRWVGHKIKRGCGALRWSANDPHYKAMPEREGVAPWSSLP